MTTIVLNSFLRSTIRFQQAAANESQRINNIQSRGEINPKNSNDIVAAASAGLSTREISELQNEIDKADDVLGGLKTSQLAVDQMRVLVDRAKDIELTLVETSDTTLTEQLDADLLELKEQIAKLGENATFKGMNLFSDWGSQTLSVGETTTTLYSVNMDDIVKGFGYRSTIADVFPIESGDFDTSSCSELIAAFGPDTVNNLYSDFTGNYPDGSMVNGAQIAQIGPNGSYGIDFPNPGGNRASGSHVTLPDLSFPAEVTMGLWARADSTNHYNKLVKFGVGGDRILLFTRVASTDNIRVRYDFDDGAGGTNSTYNDTATSPIQNGQWTFWMFTVDDLGDGTTDIAIYKDGNQVPEMTINLPETATAATYTDNLIGAGWTNDDTLDGAIADFVVMDKPYTPQEVEDWYNDVALVGLENKFFKMSADKIDTALDRIEAQITTNTVAIESTKNQMVFKQRMNQEMADNLRSIDVEEIATQSKMAELRNTLATTSLGLMSSSQNNILTLFS